MKKVVIIGAGISGLTAGIYALQKGFAAEIYEKNPWPAANVPAGTGRATTSTTASTG